MVASPAPLTCQSLVGSPASVFSQAITLTTGGPHGLAATAGVTQRTDGVRTARTATTIVMINTARVRSPFRRCRPRLEDPADVMRMLPGSRCSEEQRSPYLPGQFDPRPPFRLASCRR